MSESTLVKSVIILPYICPHCNALNSMMVQNRGDKNGFCLKCKKPLDMEDLEPQTNPELKLLLAEIKGISKTIRKENTTKKTSVGPFPIQKGYANAVRRPVHEILRWMGGVELMLETLLEAEK